MIIKIKEKTFKIKRYILKVYLKFKKPLKELLMISPSLKKLRLKAYQFNNKLTTKSKKKMIKKSFKIETNKKRKFRNLTNNQIKKKILLKIKIYKIN